MKRICIFSEFYGREVLFYFLSVSVIMSFYMAFTVYAGAIETVTVVTPSWEGQTNKDGTGLYFDIVRAIYEPAGIKMNYEIVPWKRAEIMVSENKADAMLCVAIQNIGKNMLSPKYPMTVEYTGAVFKKRKIENWKGRQTLEGRNLIWMRGYDFHKNRNLQGLKLVWEEVSMHSSAWKRLEGDRKADIFIDSVYDILNYIKTNDIDMTPYRMEILWGEKAYMAFSKSGKSEKLIEIFDRRIIELFKSGELKKLFKKWESIPYTPEAWKE